MKKFYLKISAVLFIVIAIFVFHSCEKDDNDTSGYGNDTPGTTVKTTLSGSISDENGQPVSGVTVSAHGQSTTTNSIGLFVFDNISVPKQRCIVKVVKNGFLNSSKALIPSDNNVTYFRMILMTPALSYSFNSATGSNTTLPGGAVLQLPVNGYVLTGGNPYTGTVNVKARHLRPDESDFSFKIPGGDLSGVNAAGQNRILTSYGMLSVELTGSSGQAVQLASGTSATLQLPIAAFQLALAPATIPLWYFDETTALWKEEGQAIKNGNSYEASVSHFTWWNCDNPGTQAYLQGKVVDCVGNPVANVVVTLDNFYTAVTDNNGFYSIIVLANYSFPVQVLASYNGGIILNSQVEIVPAIPSQQTFTVPDLVVPCLSRISGTIQGCNGSPGHAFVYTSWSGGYQHATYTINGSFNTAVAPSTNITVKVFNYTGSETTTITSPAPGGTVNTGNTVLCSSGTQPDNSFYVDGNGFVNELIIIDTSATYGGFNNGPFTGFPYLITINGVSQSTGNLFELNIALDDTLSSDYIFNVGNQFQRQFYFDLEGMYYVSGQTGADITFNLNQWGLPGGRIRGEFTGILMADSNVTQGSINVYNGKLNVRRQ